MTLERDLPTYVHKRPGHRREFLPTPKDTQSNLGITRPVDRESDSSHVHREEISKNSSRCACQARGRCGFRPPSPGYTVEAQTEEELDREAKPTLGVQHLASE